MKGRINNKLGEIQISSEVIALYAGMTAVECFGIVGMATIRMKDGLVKLLKRESLTKGIHVKVENNRISLDFHVIVAYGVSICADTDSVCHNYMEIQTNSVILHFYMDSLCQALPL